MIKRKGGIILDDEHNRRGLITEIDNNDFIVLWDDGKKEDYHRSEIYDFKIDVDKYINIDEILVREISNTIK